MAECPGIRTDRLLPSAYLVFPASRKTGSPTWYPLLVPVLEIPAALDKSASGQPLTGTPTPSEADEPFLSL